MPQIHSHNNWKHSKFTLKFPTKVQNQVSKWFFTDFLQKPEIYCQHYSQCSRITENVPHTLSKWMKKVKNLPWNHSQVTPNFTLKSLKTCAFKIIQKVPDSLSNFFIAIMYLVILEINSLIRWGLGGIILKQWQARCISNVINYTIYWLSKLVTIKILRILLLVSWIVISTLSHKINITEKKEEISCILPLLRKLSIESIQVCVTDRQYSSYHSYY